MDKIREYFPKVRVEPQPNFISQEAIDIILEVSKDFHYNSPLFVKKICDGRTSNQNEAINSILFTMIRKTEAIGYNVMRLGAALSVIKYNDG